MMPNFQCPVCFNYNALGDPACKVCGERFIYNCPVCNTPVDNRYPHCPNCGDLLYWGIAQQQAASKENTNFEPLPAFAEKSLEPVGVSKAGETKKAKGRPGKSLLWIILIAICVLLIVAILAIDGIINK
ncbi:MAG: hypothetical protein PHO26_06470 [Dehalococcoidia bacterium]|nr:hypothetical protein [Dehalococcoidia bacterium]MDD5493425.1 hypothetical protein [Dehalococcoidia bacterium]